MQPQPIFTGMFLKSLQQDSPEQLFVHSVETIARVYRDNEISRFYQSNTSRDMTNGQFDPVLAVDGETLYDNIQPSQEVFSALWKERLLELGKAGLRIVNAIGDLTLACDLLVGKPIEFCAPYKRELNPFTGVYITGSLIDCAPFVSACDPTLMLQISSEQTASQGIHYPILSLCNISIGS